MRRIFSLLLFLVILSPVTAQNLKDTSAKPAISSTVLDKSVAAFCDQLKQRLPRVSTKQCAAAQLLANGGSSVKGVPLFAHHVPYKVNGNGNHSKPALRVLLVGGIHGDELTSPEIVLSWIARLSEPEATAYEWKVVPLLNPDGLFAAKPQRTNANGVDLNRNFPTQDWENKAKFYWEKQVAKDPRRYPGKFPLSEPESRWLHEQLDSFKPHVIVSVHAPLGVLDFDGPAPAPRRMGRLYLDQVGVYPGSLGNYSGVQRGVPVVTLELSHALTMPTPFEQDRIWRDMLAWLKQRSLLSEQGNR